MNTIGFNLQPRMHLIPDPHMPTRMRVRWPRKGPYFQRRVKRTANDQRNYEWPEKPFVIFGGDIILCHPDYVPIVREILRRQGVGIA